VRIGGFQKASEGTKVLGPALVQEENEVGEPLGKAHVVGNDDAGESKLALEALDQVPHAPGNDWIDHGRRLIVEDQIGLRGKGSRDGHGPPPASGETRWERIDDIFGADHRDQPIYELLYLVLVQASALTQGKSDILSYAQGIEEGPILKDHGDALANGPHAFLIKVGDFLPLDENGAGIGFEKAHENTQCDRFADTASSENAEGLAAVDEEANVLKDRPAVEGDAHFAEFNKGLGGLSESRGQDLGGTRFGWGVEHGSLFSLRD